MSVFTRIFGWKIFIQTKSKILQTSLRLKFQTIGQNMKIAVLKIIKKCELLFKIEFRKMVCLKKYLNCVCLLFTLPRLNFWANSWDILNNKYKLKLYLSIYLFYLFIYSSIYLYILPFYLVSFYLSTFLYIYLYIFLSLYLSW